MIYITGDIHGFPWGVHRFCKRMRLTEHDTVILLGDVGANYYGDSRDDSMKETLAGLNPAFLCIHGNHEMRPQSVPGYELTEWNGGLVWVQKQYPNIFFARDGEIFDIESKRFIAIGGAYSVDKYYRLARGAGWWADEQPSDEIKSYVERQLNENRIDIILSHTCPFKYEPLEMFLSGIDQNTVDDSTEKWLDKIEEEYDYSAWFCGHWHTDKRIDRMHFLFHSFEMIEKGDEAGNG